jgi:hypothetical protein
MAGAVGHSNRADHVLNHRADGGICVAFSSAVGEVASQTFRLDDGAVETGSADQGSRSGHVTTTHDAQDSGQAQYHLNIMVNQQM